MALKNTGDGELQFYAEALAVDITNQTLPQRIETAKHHLEKYAAQEANKAVVAKLNWLQKHVDNPDLLLIIEEQLAQLTKDKEQA